MEGAQDIIEDLGSSLGNQEKSLKDFKQENDSITLNVSFRFVSCSFYHGVQLTASSHWVGLYVHTDSNHSGN